MGGVYVANQTDQTLEFRVFGGDRWYSLGSLDPGARTQVIPVSQLYSTTAYARDGCTTGVIAAFDSVGNEVARHEPGLCAEDEWVVSLGTASPSAT